MLCRPSLKLNICVAVIGWLAVIIVRFVLLRGGGITLLLLFIGLAVFVTLHSVCVFYLLMSCLDERSSNRTLKRYPGVYRVQELPSSDSVVLLAPNVTISVGDYGWQAEAVQQDELVYLQGLNENWYVVWYAGFKLNQLEYVCDKPENQFDRRSWQSIQNRCPFIVIAQKPNIETFGLPMQLIGRWVQGVYVPMASKASFHLPVASVDSIPRTNATGEQ